ncbi:multicopper oxidase domain-containing protein [Streptomyces sp. ACA25]|uniref:multicopper oxidase domain-containing protein n=1 Tax=Streptomyces sp. ACA25 TaxID=3022596 RepID=UPI002308106A|nr:multicopper oxidase domain-containing protein [Streptomyces sp. ACA25]MDB1086776.1 multicopper oxidase domain-containing protein [Streptomyces sp. ACA25]
MTALPPPSGPRSPQPSAKPSAPRTHSPRTRWHLGVNTLVAAWLLLFAVSTVAHPFVPVARWLLVHLLLLGAVSNAIVIWSGHFTASVLRLPEADRGTPAVLRLAALNAGVIGVIAGMTAGIPGLVAAGAAAVAGAALAHAVWLVRMLRRALPARFAMTVRYYIAAAALLPAGAALGVIMASGGHSADGEARLLLAHELVNLLGWVGLTVTGTLITLWPTMLRTRVAEGAERAARRALPVLLTGLGVAVAAAFLGPPPAAALGVAGYAAGLVIAALPWVREARARPPHSFATWSVAAGAAWLTGTLFALAALLVTAGSWAEVAQRTPALTAPLAAGWIAQVLLGALSFLVPVVLGGGPAAVRAATGELERAWPARLAAANAALLLCLLPVPSTVRVTSSLVLLAMLVAFLVLLVRAVLANRRARRNPAPKAPAVPPDAGQRHRVLGGTATGLALVVLAVAGGGAADVGSLPVAGPPTTAGAVGGGEVVATGATTTVTVRVNGMRFTPDSVDVPAGDRLVVDLHNTGDDHHDLVLGNGTRTGRLAPGEQETLEAGVIDGDLEGWCSLVGHRQMGMVFDVRVTGEATGHDEGSEAPGHGGEPDGAQADRDGADSAAADFDPMAVPDDGFAARDARLPPATEGSGARVHRHTLTVEETAHEVAPGVRQTLWTFGGTAPGPALRGRVGDTFEITLVNDGSLGHSIDFHAGSLAPDRPMRTIPPGETLTYRFTATHSGVWMYHCSTMPMSAHIASGMFGAVVIDPPDLPPVDHEYLLVQSELYLGPQGGTTDADKLRAEQPDAVVFNGYANQYVHDPLTARTGERVRIWVLAAGPNRPSAFHVVGGQFDTLYLEGAHRLRPEDPGNGGAQVLGLEAASGGFVELSFPEAGTYPFVSHRMIDAERGAQGAFRVLP